MDVLNTQRWFDQVYPRVGGVQRSDVPLPLQWGQIIDKFAHLVWDTTALDNMCAQYHLPAPQYALLKYMSLRLLSLDLYTLRVSSAKEGKHQGAPVITIIGPCANTGEELVQSGKRVLGITLEVTARTS